MTRREPNGVACEEAVAGAALLPENFCYEPDPQRTLDSVFYVLGKQIDKRAYTVSLPPEDPEDEPEPQLVVRVADLTPIMLAIAKQWRAVTPKVPGEPPNGSILRTDEGTVWIRDDLWGRTPFDPDSGDPDAHWFRGFSEVAWTWAQAVADGAGRARPLIALDPSDEAQVRLVEEALSDPEHRTGHITGWDDLARAALRALAEGTR